MNPHIIPEKASTKFKRSEIFRIFSAIDLNSKEFLYAFCFVGFAEMVRLVNLAGGRGEASTTTITVDTL